MTRVMAIFMTAALAFSGAQAVEPATPDCSRFTAHTPAADVAFQPGVDARGNRVAPADLNGAQVDIPDRVRVAITVELADRLGIPVGGDANFSGEAQIGTVEVAPDGRAWFNGQPLADPTAVALSRLCQEVLR